MINIDDRLLTKVDHNEMWLLIHITKRLNKKLFCFPSNETLLRDTKWKIDKLRAVKKSLIDKGLILVEIVEGRSNNYYVDTDEIGVFASAKTLSGTPSEKPTGSPEKPIGGSGKNQQATPSEKPTGKYYPFEVLNNNHSDIASQVIGVIDELKIIHGKYTNRPEPLLITPKRKSLVNSRMKDFKAQWPGSDFMISVRYVFEYKAKEWKDSDMWKFFKPETLLSSDHFLDYCEQAKTNKGTPPKTIEKKTFGVASPVYIPMKEGTNNQEVLNGL